MSEASRKHEIRPWTDSLLQTSPADVDKSTAVGCRQDLLIYLRAQSRSEELSNLIF
jgi:hypothetical protein